MVFLIRHGSGPGDLLPTTKKGANVSRIEECGRETRDQTRTYEKLYTTTYN